MSIIDKRKGDALTWKRINTAHPKLRSELEQIYAEVNERLKGSAVCRFSHVLRTFKEQDELYAFGRTRKGRIVTNAKGGQSYHNYGLACDIVLIINGKEASWDTKKDWDGDGIADWMEVVQVFVKHGWTWGGHFKKLYDAPHFEKTFGKSTRDLLALHKAGKIDKEGYVNI